MNDELKLPGGGDVGRNLIWRRTTALLPHLSTSERPSVRTDVSPQRE
jgi:hypothetical protein